MVEVTQVDHALAEEWREEFCSWDKQDADEQVRDLAQAFALHREAAMQAQSGNWQETLNELARLEAENARLREALAQIDRHVSHGKLGDWHIAFDEIRKTALDAPSNPA